jgi:hypothetical protein
MIRSNRQLFGRMTFKRTYTYDEWVSNRDAYIAEARKLAKERRPAVVYLYRKDGRGYREQMAKIVAH